MNLKARKALAELEALPGMHNVKEQVEQMIQFAHISKLRKEKGLKTDRHSNHVETCVLLYNKEYYEKEVKGKVKAEVVTEV